MTLDLEKYKFTDGTTDLSASEFNSRFYAIIRRLHALELLSIDWTAAVSEVRNYGLARINDAVKPLLDSLSVDLAALVVKGKVDLASQSAAIDAALAEVDAVMALVETRIAKMEASVSAIEVATDTHIARSDNPHAVTAAQTGAATVDKDGHLVASELPISTLVGITRDMWAGMIVEWECATIPTLADGIPMGLELDGAIVSLAVYPRLTRIWCGSTLNASVQAWYKCGSTGTRDAAGLYMKLQDRRAMFPRGFDHGRGIDTGRTIGSVQAFSTQIHTHYSNTNCCNQVGWAGAANYFAFGMGGNYGGASTGIPDSGYFSNETRPWNIATMFIVLV